MGFGLLARLAGVAVLVMVANILCTVLYMVAYGHLINPGHDEAFYQAHVQIAAPYCSIVAGIPLMLLAGWWVAGWNADRSSIIMALTVWGVYTTLDGAILVASGASSAILPLFTASFGTKLVAVSAGAALHSRRAQPV
jgi:hypothetical protein